MMDFMLRALLGGVLAVSTALASPALQAQPAWPTKPIRWIVPYPAGGPLDGIGRKLADAVAAQTGQPVVIENRTGAYGSLGAAEVARSRPDGYTFLLSSSDTFINAMALLKQPPYDARKDFAYLTQVADAGPVLMLAGDAGESTLSEVVAAARAKGSNMSYGSWGAGSYTHLLMEALAQRTGADFLHVPYRGAMPAIQDLLGRRLRMTFAPANVAAQFAEKGAVKLVAVSGEQRSPLLPAVPTFREAGYDAPIFRMRVWLGLAAPAGLAPEIREAMVRQIHLALARPEVAKFITDAGFAPIGNTSTAFRQSFDAEYPIVTKMIKDAGVVPQ